MTTMIAGLPGGMEWVILLVVALLLFGGSRLAGMGKGAGRAIREFKEEVRGPEDADSPVTEPTNAELEAPTTHVTSPATTTTSTTTPVAKVAEPVVEPRRDA